MSYAYSIGAPFPDLLVGAAILVLRAEQRQLSIVAVQKRDFLSFRHGVRKLNNIVSLCRELF